MRSMTGFGRCRRTEDERTVEIELRSVNHRFLKLQMRLPRELQALEAPIEAEIKRSVARGSLNLTIRCSETGGRSSVVVDRELALDLHRESRDLAAELGLEAPGLEAILRLPGVVRPADPDEGPDEAQTKLVMSALEEAVAALSRMREEEGERLLEELRRLKARIGEEVAEVAQRAPEVVSEYSAKLAKRLNQLLAQNSDRVTVLENDLLREVALFADRADISEELQRLSSHLEQFDEVVASEEVGRKLDFLLQEMLRETNTIASKAADSEVARRVIEIKTDLERLREQAQNIE